ncbi:RNA exonuclease 4 isoform X2 [Sesamum indicum]|uniref:RNA exonuclease 4 n=1 Tax=Sesamum indicum TaxID=4182 RepID=A0A8M8V2P3_SESIN|nr:RNA exonuclease 4 isoform X2 [Sesamum indicum]
MQLIQLGGLECKCFEARNLVFVSASASSKDIVSQMWWLWIVKWLVLARRGTRAPLEELRCDWQVNKWGNVIYDEFVRPVEYVVDFRTEISGIRPSDLRKAKNFTVVQKKVAELIKGRILVGHALRNDLKALLLSHPKKDIRDTSEYTPFLQEGRRRSLKNLASQFLTVDIQNGAHCPIEDARAAMLLYQRNRKQWERSIKDFTRLKEKQKKRKPKKNRKVEKD